MDSHIFPIVPTVLGHSKTGICFDKNPFILVPAVCHYPPGK